MSLHLVEHHPVEEQLVSAVFEADSLLQELLLLQKRAKNRVQIDAKDVLEILVVGGAEKIKGEVGASHCVLERLQRSVEHFEEGVFDWILLAPTQHDVLQYVRNALVVLGFGVENYTKSLVCVAC